MKFGVGDFSGQLPAGSGHSHREIYFDLLDQARLIEGAGLDSMWVSEHHFAPDGYMPSVLILAAAALARTERITIGTDRLSASLHHPIRLAEDAIALDLMSGGRFVLGLSLTYRQEELTGFHMVLADEVDRLEELAKVLRRAFAGKPFSHRGKHFDIPRVTITPPPLTPGGPRLMIAGDGPVTEGPGRAARLADAMMVDPVLPWADLERLVEAYDRTRGDSQGEIAPFVYGGLHPDGREAAWREVADGFRYMRHNYDRWMGKPPTAELPPASYRLLLGTPADVAQQALAYRARFGDRVHLVLRLNYPGMPAAAVARQISLWGEAAALARG
jgi:alkanesulfonate monooxygenase SsuD/methylene tetrahydromethanopterin reductase-like flavin-dependent oxidoreductase (luciferase family)